MAIVATPMKVSELDTYSSDSDPCVPPTRILSIKPPVPSSAQNTCWVANPEEILKPLSGTAK